MSRLLVTEDAVRRAVVAEALKDVGFQGKVGGYTKWGAWYGSAWTNAYFCAAGWSYCWNIALGETDARAVIGHQTHGGVAPNKRGFIWTVAIMEQHRAKKVALKNLKPGDALMFRYISGDNRQGNEVNHVDLVERNFPDRGFLYVIGYNVPKPGATSGDPSRGGGVYRRQIWYSDKNLVAGLQMPAAELAERNRKAWTKLQLLFNDFGLGKFEGTGTPGPATMAAVNDYAKAYGYSGSKTDPFAILAHMEAYMKNVENHLKDIKSTLDEAKLDRAEMSKQLTALETALAKVPSAEVIVKTFLSWMLYGAPIHWWLRNGAILDPGHRNFPADPNSLAWYRLRGEAVANGNKVTVYTVKGEVAVPFDPETNRFVPVSVT